MGGFLYRLFVEKWKLYRGLYVARLVVDLLVVALLATTALTLKTAPELQASLRPVLVATLALMGLLMVEELRITLLWLRSESQADDLRDMIPLSQRLRNGMRFLNSHYVLVLFASYSLGAAAAVTLQTTEIEVHTLGAGRLLRAGTGSSTSTSTSTTTTSSSTASSNAVSFGLTDRISVGDSGEATGAVWVALGLSILLIMPYIASSLFTPFESFNVFLLSIVRILRNDLLTFLAIFAVYLATFFLALYTLYPRCGAAFLPHMPAFNDWHTSAQALLELAFTGSPPSLDLIAASQYEGLSASQTASLALFGGVYLFYAILSVVLLLNLLIAMFTHTFENVRSESTLNSRVGFAQMMLRLELVASSLGMRGHIGEHKGDGAYAFDFRSNAAGGPTVGGSARGQSQAADPFAKTVDGPFEKLELRLEKLQQETIRTLRKELRQALGKEEGGGGGGDDDEGGRTHSAGPSQATSNDFGPPFMGLGGVGAQTKGAASARGTLQRSRSIKSVFAVAKLSTGTGTKK